MAKITKEAALLYHSQGKPGKIEVVPTKPYSTQTDFSLAYSPGVAEPCLEIEKNPQDAYKYTAKGNLVALSPTVLPYWVWVILEPWQGNRSWKERVFCSRYTVESMFLTLK